MIKKNLLHPLLLLILASCLASAGSITYNQDGSPIFTNGSSADSANNLNADDGTYYNINPGTSAGPSTLNLPIGCKTPVTCTGSGTPVCTCAQINASDSSYANGASGLRTTGALTEVYVDENLSATSAEIPDDATITSVIATVVYYVSNAASCSLDVWNGTAFTTYSLGACATSITTVTQNVTPTLDTIGKIRSARLRMRYTAGATNRNLYLDMLNLTVNYTRLNRQINVTHNSTATVSIPTGHLLNKSEAHIIAKSNNSATPTYTISWYSGGSYTTTGCSAATTLVTGSDTDLSCSDTTNPANAISSSKISVRLSTNIVNPGFQLNEDYVYFKIWYPNLTSTTKSPSADPSPYEGGFFQFNCSSSVDVDFGISNANYYLLLSNDSGATWNTLTTSSPGLQLNSTTPTNPFTSQSISEGGTTTKSWYVNAVTAGSYQLKCVTNSTSAGEQNSTALTITASLRPASLAIWDDTDTVAKYPNDQVYFYANYTMSNGTIIDGNGTCRVSFNISGGWTAWANMTYNGTLQPYHYNRSFPENGTFDFNVSCNSTGYQAKSATSNFTITAAVAAVVSTGKSSYYGCSTVYYRVRLYNTYNNLVNDQFSVNITDPSAAQKYYASSLTPNNGTGIYLSSYSVDASESPGSWLIKAVSGLATGTAVFGVSP